MSPFRLFLEALVVGISTIVIGLLVHVVMGYHAQHASSPTMKREMIQLVVTLFLTGFFVHIVYEGMGANAVYCRLKMKSADE